MMHVVENNQSIIDVALMHYGNIDAVFELLKQNNLNIEPINVGSIVELIDVDLKNINKDIVDYISKNNLIFATYSNEMQGVNNWILATNFWRDLGDWIDTEYWRD